MIGFIILNYIKWEETVKCIKSIITNYDRLDDIKIYIVDNASPDKPPKELLNLLINIKHKFIYSDTNRGYAAGNNLGLKQALIDNCSAVFITNNDIYFQKDSISNIIKFYDRHSGICFPKIFKLDGTVSNVSQKYITSIFDLYIYITPLKYIFRKKYKKMLNNIIDIDSKNIIKTHLNLGPCFTMDYKSACLLTPLDENTILFFEEMILSMKADKLGIGIYYIPYSHVIHGEGKSSKKGSLFGRQCMDVSTIYYGRKYLGGSKLIMLPMILFFMIRYSLKCISKKSLDKFKEYKSNINHVYNID